MQFSNWDSNPAPSISTLHRWQSSSEFELLRSDASELLVVFLSHDDCMKEIFGVDGGKFVNTFIGNDALLCIGSVSTTVSLH